MIFRIDFRQMTLAFRLPLAATALLATSAAHLYAQGNAQSSVTSDAEVSRFVDDGASERIALAGELGMLSQRVVSAACFLHAGLEPDSSRATLNEATSEFETIAAALEFGNPELGIPTAEERRRTLAGLNKLNNLWAPIAELAQKVDADGGTARDIAAIAIQSGELFETANRLVVQITSQYSGQTTVLQSDALRLDLAGRQRTLAQQIAKTGCLISRDIEVDTSTSELQMAAGNFDVSMNALRFGLQDVGILPPPNDEIVASLDEVANNWSFMSRIVTNLTAGNSVDDITLGVMFLMSNQVTGNMETVVEQYTEASKLAG